MAEIEKGGEFLLKPIADGEIFIREDLTPDQVAFGDAVADFVRNEVLPQSDAIEAQADNISSKLLKKAGELGFLMAEIPEAYSGLGLDKRTATVIIEELVKQGSFGVTMMCHTGIGTLPILYYGTEDQKKKYLPKLASGEFIGAYALTEAGSGSDALAAKTKAVLSPDGKNYILNGSKMWITNGSWADIFTVFAKVDGDKFTAFLVEKGTPGFTLGKEEHKMGIKGSSTVALSFDNCPVPVENVLGEVGKGHKIAFNVLNIGRWKLGAASVGGAKKVIADMITYAKERKQFGKSLVDFGLVRKKIADSVTRTFVMESVIYRIAGLYDIAIESIDTNDPTYGRKVMDAIENYAIEASIAKVYASEALWSVCDDGVQVLGGYGFSAEYPMERAQRDSRINRIFEGTNEINRLIIPGTLLKRAMKGEMDLMGAIQGILGELKQGFNVPLEGDIGSGSYSARVDLAKKLALYASGVAVQKYMAEIQEHQLVLEKIADLVIEAYAMDSTLRRVHQLLKKEADQPRLVPGSSHPAAVNACRIAVTEGYDRVLATARQLLADVADGNAEEYARYKKALKRFDIFDPVNTARARDVVATQTITAGGYKV